MSTKSFVKFFNSVITSNDCFHAEKRNRKKNTGRKRGRRVGVYTIPRLQDIGSRLLLLYRSEMPAHAATAISYTGRPLSVPQIHSYRARPSASNSPLPLLRRRRLWVPPPLRLGDSIHFGRRARALPPYNFSGFQWNFPPTRVARFVFFTLLAPACIHNVQMEWSLSLSIRRGKGWADILIVRWKLSESGWGFFLRGGYRECLGLCK